jgi:hypothetical protein
MRRRHIQPLPFEEIRRIAEDIYIYGYPLVVMDVMKRTHTATPRATLHSAPVNQFSHARFLPEPHDKYGVHPNADCLTSAAWLDLGREPVVLTIPQSSRHYLLSFFSGWYEIFGSCSLRNRGAFDKYVGFVGPHWFGRLPSEITRISAPTEIVWLHGLFEARGDREDVDVVHALQDGFQLSSLSEWPGPAITQGLPSRTDVDTKTTPCEQAASLDARTYYTRLSRLMERNPPQAGDTEMITKFAQIGFFPSDDFAFDTLSGDAVRAMYAAVTAAHSKITAAEKTIGYGKAVNSWLPHFHPGSYEKHYLDRAGAARAAVPAALAEDMVSFHTAVDHTDEPLHGAKQYVIHFPSDRMPPVHAFWSITLYDARQHLVPNHISRYAIGDRDRLRLHPDNSLSIYIQHEWPGADKDSNWLPAPKDSFSLALKIYWPKPDALTGIWRPPAVTRAQ